MRLGNLSGTKETIVNPVFTLLDKNRMQLSAKLMSLLSVAEGDRVDVMLVEDTFFIAKETGKLGRAISKTGLFQHPATHSFMAEAASDDRATFMVNSELTMEADNLLWFGMSIMTKPEAVETVVKEEEELTGSAETPELLTTDQLMAEPTTEEVEDATEEEHDQEPSTAVGVDSDEF